jgi:fibronectin type III domain protein
MQRQGFRSSGVARFSGGALLGCLVLIGAMDLLAQSQSPIGSPVLQARSGRHEAHANAPGASELQSGAQAAMPPEPELPPPTRSSFMASWTGIEGAIGYRLDVSKSSSFNNYIDGYRDLDVGNVTARVVNGLDPGTTYYYRVRSLNASGLGSYSRVMTSTTQPATGLIIQASFDTSITGNSNAAAIEAMINRAVGVLESQLNDPITIHILFRYSMTAPNGHTLSHETVSRSDFVVYTIPWGAFVSALRADAKTSNDSMAIASLPGSMLAPNINPASANGRAVGLDTPPSMFANGTVGNGGPYDGIVTLNSGVPFQFTRPPIPNRYDAQRSTEHEMDEILGLGSEADVSNLQPEDLFSWSSAGHRNITSSGLRYLSINGGITNIVKFNQDSSGDLGDWFSPPCPQPNPFVQDAFTCTGQYDDVATTSPEGVALDVIGYDLNQTILGNISTRAFVQTGNNVMIGGFIVSGNEPKRVIVRAIGPELSHFGVPNPLADPILELHDGSGALIASNNNWQTTIIGGIITTNQVSDIQNSGHAPTAATESAIIANLPPGNYTAIVRGVNNTTGVALVEAYDLSLGVTSILGNISTRAFVQTGDNVMIGGFIVSGTASRKVIVRAIGPELSQFGVPNPLADPTLELHDGNGTLIASNNNWQTTIIGGIITGNQATDIQNSGHAPTAASESAIIAILPPGNYTAIVRGVNNTIGVALVEAYSL